MKLRPINPDNKCYLCSAPANYWNSAEGIDICSKRLEDCPGYKVFHRHIDNCPSCKEKFNAKLNSNRYYVRQYKCYKLLYIRAKIRKCKSYSYRYLYKLQKGYLKCSVCGTRTAIYNCNWNSPCCQPSKKECPEWHSKLSELKKNLYNEHPTYRENMSKAMKKVHNTEEVKRAKQLKMLHLHNDNCEECLEFKENFLKSHELRKGNKLEKTKR